MKNKIQFSSMTLSGTIFSSDIINLICTGNSIFQTAEDYNLLPGIRFADQISRSFSIAKALFKEFESKRTSENAKETTEKFIQDFFEKALDYSDYKKINSKTVNEKTYSINAMASHNIPLVIAPYTKSLEETDLLFTIQSTLNRKKSAFSLLQLFLNADKECTWGIVTNSKEIKLLRDSESMVRPNYLCFDIENILKNSLFADYYAFWYIFHSSRTEVWENWRKEGITNGTRVRDGLREGVTNALLHLGAGFLQTSGEGNDTIRETLRTGIAPNGKTYTKNDFYKALLREVYRFLFLSTIEERDLLFTHNEGFETEHKIYNEGYSIHRLALKVQNNAFNDKHTDLWEGFKIVFKGLQEGCPQLDLTALGGIFAKDQCPLLDNANLDNIHLLKAIKQLRWCFVNGTLTFTDYRNMGTEEFGSVYESLLELVPQIDLDSRTFSFVGIGNENGIQEDGSTKGNARKTSGSYYTNAELVSKLVESALLPALEKKLSNYERVTQKNGWNKDYESEILSFTVVDPACGSGHFLLQAARKIAEVLAEKRAGDNTVTDSLYRKSLRDVIANCIYGVDLNQMAVELARTALWLEGFESGKPLEFINHHIKCGNSLVGVFDLNVLNNGIPDMAFKALSGDDKSVCQNCKKTNTDELNKKDLQGTLFSSNVELTTKEITSLLWQIKNIKGNTIQDENKKAELHAQLLKNKDFIKLKTACNVYTAAFYIPKTKENQNLILTSQDLFDIKNDVLAPGKEGAIQKANQIAEEYKFFHWPVEFAQVYEKSKGFDCVLGNPPWDKIKVSEKEFFAQERADIAEAKNKAERDKLINDLKTGYDYEKELYNRFQKALHTADATSNFVHFKDFTDCRYLLTGIGDVNMYALFAELIYNLQGINGTAGFIVPSGIATDDSTKNYFAQIATSGILKSLYDFENRDALFPTVDSRFKFSLVTLAPKDGLSDFAFFLHNIQDLNDSRRHFTMLPEDFDLINPNTHTCPVFRSEQDAKLAKKIYKKSGIFVNEVTNQNPWNVSFSTMYHMSNDSSLFRDSSFDDQNGYKVLPLYEAKMMHQADHRYSTYQNGKTVDVTTEQKQDAHFCVTPQYYVPYTETVLRATNLPAKIVTELRPALNKDAKTEQIQKLRDAFFKQAGVEKLAKNKERAELYESLSTAKTTDLLQKAFELAVNDCPKYLIGWRNITNATNERTLIASVLPLCGAGNSAAIANFFNTVPAALKACLLANLNSLTLDFVTRMKVGGTNFNFFIVKQLPILSPTFYTQKDIDFISPRIMALTYTSYDIIGWAQSLWQDSSLESRLKMIHLQNNDNSAINDTSFVNRDFSESFLPPFKYKEEQREIIRAELDAYFARLYNISRTELQYILRPQSVMSEDYPSETFRVLYEGEMAKYGEYKTERLILEAWDKMDRGI